MQTADYSLSYLLARLSLLGPVPNIQKAHSRVLIVPEMSLRDAVQNAASPTFTTTTTLACTVTITIILACYCMSKYNFFALHFRLVFRLLLELTLLATVSFTAALIVLSAFHARLEQNPRQPSPLDVVIDRKSSGPFGFVSTRVG